MARSRKASAAARALQAAIREETADLHATIRLKDAEIHRLHGVLQQVMNIVGSVPRNGERASLPQRVEPEQEAPQVPPIDLADEDQLGEGRWA